MISCLCVGAGGMAGAMLRYLTGIWIHSEGFPVATFFVNVMGAVVIGFIIGASEKAGFSPNLILFFKTGFCGGFTTFSTFSAEVLDLWEKKEYLTGSGYAIGSVMLCVLGVFLGRTLADLFVK